MNYFFRLNGTTVASAMMTLEAKQKLAQSKIAQMIRPVSMPNLQTSKKTASPSADNENEMQEVPAEKATEEPSDIKPSSYNLRPIYSSVNINCDKWLLTMDEGSRAKLENPPSFPDGIDRKTEEDIRYLGCELIQSGAILLRLPQTAAATGQILFHRFYYQKSFATYHFEHAVMACLLLASKIEEAPRRARDVINVFHRLEQLNRLHRAGRPITSESTAKLQPRLLDARYVNTKNMVIKTERRILCALGFVVHVKHPHKLLVSYLYTLKLGENKELIQRAWSYMNDGLRTDMFVRYRPETIACACIFLAARTVAQPVTLPSTPFPWFELFDASDRDVNAIALTLLNLYRRKRPNWAALNARLEEVHTAKLPVKPEPNKTESIVKKILEETEKYRKNDENGRDERGRKERGERSPKRRREASEGRRKERREDRRRDERRRDRDEKRRDDRDKKRDRQRDLHDRARERSKQREREVYQTLGKRNRGNSPELPSRVRK